MNIITIPLDHWTGHDPEYKFNERHAPIRDIVLHSTDGIDSRDWLSKWNKKQETAQNNVSIHYLIQRDGVVYRIIADEKRAWHVGISQMPDGETDGNSYSIGIELEHKNEPNYPEAQLQSAAILVDSLMKTHDIDGAHVVSHASVARPLKRKIDPVHFDWADFWDRIAKLQEAPTETKWALPYTEYSYTLASPHIDAGKLVEYLVNKRVYKNYTKADVQLILNYYIKYGKAIGVDYIFAIAQMIHETGWLDSWWAARGTKESPRRNPAGIGVTGQIALKDPNDPIRWAKSDKIWRKGQSFESWDIAVQHHLARLLLYAAKDSELTAEQLAFTQICRDRERLDRIRGVAKQWIGFNGVWAVPGRTYAKTLATLSNSFISASQ